jgi:hypothetical protein
MASVLTTGSTVVCGHAGVVTLTSAAKLTVQGRNVLTAASLGPVGAGGATCQTVGPGTVKCTNVTISGGQSSKLQAGGASVLLDTLAGTTNGNPPGMPTAVAGQTRLTAL